ncbi:hypothetical protein [Escherichia coli]
MMSLWDALRMNMMISYQELVRTFPRKALGYFETTRPSMSFTDNWSDEEFIRQMKELIGNEGDIHVTCNHSEGEQVTETHVHAAGVNVSPEGRS